MSDVAGRLAVSPSLLIEATQKRCGCAECYLYRSRTSISLYFFTMLVWNPREESLMAK